MVTGSSILPLPASLSAALPASLPSALPSSGLPALISSVLPAPFPLIALAILQIIFVFALAPLLVGLMRKTKARMQGRTGSPVYQPYIDLVKLLSKGTAKSSVSSFVFVIAPLFCFVSIAIAALLLPILSSTPPIAASIIVFIYLFSVGRFLFALSGLDAGSSFGGMGSSREMLYSILIEPALFAIIIFLAASTIGPGISPLASDPASWSALVSSPPFWLVAISLFVAILAETGRLPFDNPATHLELTMVHEAMILENSGPDLALIEWAQAAKMFLFLSLAAALLLPGSLQSSPWWPAILLAFAALLAVLVAVVESLSVKMRLFKVSKLLILSALLGIMAFLLHLFGAPAAGESAVSIALVLVMLLSAIYILFSVTFRRRLELYVVQGLCLAAIYLMRYTSAGAPDALYLLAATVVLKIIVIPMAFYYLFRGMPGEVKLMPWQFYLKFGAAKESFKLDLNFDPLFTDAPTSVSRSLIFAAILIGLAFMISPAIGGATLMLPLVVSLILIGMLIIATKTHLLLQLLGFLVMENGVVLLPFALRVQLPLIGEAVALFDVVVLVAIALLLSFKMRSTHGTLDTKQLVELTEKR